MPGIGWTELLVIVAIAIVVVGPKDLPILMRTLGRFVGKARAMAREFQDSFEEIARESELEELRKENEKLQQAMMMPAMDAMPMTPSEEAALRETTNAPVMAAEANVKPAAEMTPLQPGGPAAAENEPSNITPFRGGARR